MPPKPVDTSEWLPAHRLENLGEHFPLPHIVLLAWDYCSKGEPRAWGGITQAHMTNADYLAKFTVGELNIGVATGEVSGFLGALDLGDVDASLGAEFEALNPQLAGSLRTFATNWGQLWVFIDGPAPAGCNLYRDGKRVGEWRFGPGHQSIVVGMHPDEVPYCIQPGPIRRVKWSSIKWPEGLSATTWDAKTGEIYPERPALPEAAQSGTALTVVGVEVLDLLLKGKIPPYKNQTNASLLMLAQTVLGYQYDRAPFSEEALLEIFREWFNRCYKANVLRLVAKRDSRGKMRPANTFESHWKEFRRALETAHTYYFPDPPFDRCWLRVNRPDYVMPPSAALFASIPRERTRRMVQLVAALFFELQQLTPGEPVWVSSEDLREKVGMKQRNQPAAWIRKVADAKVIKLVSKSDRRKEANHYVYVHQAPQPQTTQTQQENVYAH